ncbi:MAG: hypothetical protein H6707_15705 [Deltaproteobacteria bacterium]|nr:hypothetical protein [Deltaproteobacteria bacterium]
MAASTDTVHQYFDNYGWQYEFDPTTTTWRTGFRGDTSNFNIIVHLTENWLFFALNPFVNCPKDPACTPRLHHHLLRLNHVVNMAKFSVDEEGDVVLTVELPTESLDYSDFADGLNALSYYADTYYLDILNLAQNPDYEPTLPVEDGDPPVGDNGDRGLEMN